MSKVSRKNRVGAVIGSWQSEVMNDYERIAQVIRFLDERHVEPVSYTHLDVYKRQYTHNKTGRHYYDRKY